MASFSSLETVMCIILCTCVCLNFILILFIYHHFTYKHFFSVQHGNTTCILFYLWMLLLTVHTAIVVHLHVRGTWTLWESPYISLFPNYFSFSVRVVVDNWNVQSYTVIGYQLLCHLRNFFPIIFKNIIRLLIKIVNWYRVKTWRLRG